MQDFHSGQQAALGLITATSLVIGVMIGSGIFLLPVSLAAFSGYSLFGWLIAALGAISLAWVFAKLSQSHPGPGGPYHYTRVGVGEFPAFLVAWGYWISIWTGNAAVIVAAVSYLGVFFPVLNEGGIEALLVSLIIIWLFTLINCLGVRSAAKVQVVTTFIKVIPLLLFTFGGIFFINFEYFTLPDINQLDFSPQQEVGDSSFSIVIASATLCMWAFMGVESATIPADHVKKPSVTIPRATLIGVAIVAIIYILGFVVIMGVIPSEQLQHSKAPFADAARYIWGDLAGLIMGAIAVISSLGVLNGLILLGGQMPKTAANDQLFPGLFSRLNRFQAPMFGIIFSSILTSGLLISNYSGSLTQVFTFAILLSTTSILIAYLFCSAAAFRFQMQKKKSLYYAVSCVVILFAFVFSLWAMIGAGESAVYWGFILILLGIPVYIGLKIQADRNESYASS